MITKKQGQIKPIFEGYPSEGVERHFLTDPRLSVGTNAVDISETIKTEKADYRLSIPQLLKHSMPGTYEIVISYQSSRKSNPSEEKLSVKKNVKGEIVGSAKIELENVTKIISATARKK